jgi:carbon-monoxide dehydrogenase medium subunit
MLPHRFEYLRPRKFDAALEYLDRYGEGAAPYAGGTELLLALKARVLRYDCLVDLKRISELVGIREEGDEIVVGALSTHHVIATDAIMRQRLPAYAELSANIANIRVRVAGTIGGNLCFAEPHADPPALLAAYGARLLLRSPSGEREINAADFIEGEFTTSRKENEILSAIRIPVPQPGAKFCYRSFGHLERPAVGVAAGYVPDSAGAHYRVWIGAIAGRPIRLDGLERALDGVPARNLNDVVPEAAQTAAQSLPATSDLHGSADYKRHLAAVFVRRALAEAAGVSGGKD